MILHLQVLGAVLIALSLLHLGFPRYFEWRRDLAPLMLINRQMMYVHAGFIALVVLMIGLLCVTSAGELTTTLLGRRIALFIGIFWAARLLVQFTGYSSALWKGKRFETWMHVLFSLLWVYSTAVFLLVALG